jgi:hypothetical protein
MMDGHGGHSLDLSFVSIALYTLVAVAIVLIVVGYVVYRRALRDGRWDRVMGRGRSAGLRAGPRQELARLYLTVDQSLTTARGALDVMDADGATIGDLELLVGHLEDLGARLCAQMDLVDARASDDAVSRVVTALAAPVGEVEALAGRVAEALGAALSGAAAIELREIDAEFSGALRVLDHRLATLQELSTVRAVDDGAPGPCSEPGST